MRKLTIVHAIHTRESLRKHGLRKPDCKTLRKVHFLLGPPPPVQAVPTAAPGGGGLPPASSAWSSSTSPDSSSSHAHTHRKRSLPLLCLPQILYYPDTPTNIWWNTRSISQFFQVHSIVCNFPDLNCSHIFFHFKSLSRRSRHDRTSTSLIPLSLNVFSISLTLAKGRQNKKSLDIIGHGKKLDRQQADCPTLAFEIEPSSFAILQQIRNCTGLKCKVTWV